MRTVVPKDWREGRNRVCLSVLVVLAASGVLTACDLTSDPAPDTRPAVTTGTFIDVITALREANREVMNEDSAGALFEARRAEILAQHDVTEDDLHAFVLRNGRDTELMREVWDSINERLKHARLDPADIRGGELQLDLGPDRMGDRVPDGDTTRVPDRGPDRIPR